MQVLNVPTPAYLADEEFSIFRESVGRFLDDNAPPEKSDGWRKAKVVERDLWIKAGAAGLLGLSTCTAYGGVGGDFRHESILIEETSRRGLDGWGASLHNAIVMPYIEIYGTEDQKKRWLPKLARGDYVGAIAMTEPGTGSDLQSVRTKAIRQGDQYVIDGAKTFISNGLLANLVVTVAKTDPEDAAKGISLLVVETDGLDGFSRGRVLKKIGQHGQDTAELFFDGARVPADCLLGAAEGQGFIQLMQQLPQERLVLAVGAVAAIEEALAHTLRYTKDRRAFGKPVFEFQNTRFKLAEMATTATIARVFVDDCVVKHIRGELDVPTASMAKWWTTQMQCDVADECLQFFGGYGYMQEYPISRMFTDARIQKIYGGTNEIMKEIISRFL
jgi:long-chain-acyl-CoA dehydrogenase